MTQSRPAPMGNYELLQDFEGRAASVRVLRLASQGEVMPHLHHRSLQLYVALDGVSVISVDGVERELQPYEVTEIAPGTPHAARPAATTSILLNVSVPPLAADDQLPAQSQAYREDLQLPHAGTDIED